MKRSIPNSNLLATCFACIVLGLIAASCGKLANAQSTNPPADFTSGIVKVDPSLSHGLQEIWDATTGSTNFAIAAGAGRGIKGDKNMAYLDYIYNMTGNVVAVLGYDAINVGRVTTYNFVKGGLQLKADIYPLKNLGFPTFKVTPFTALLINSGGGKVGQIVVAGASHRFTISKTWGLNIGGFYENRSGGDSAADGVYVCGMFAFSHNF
jgi:hypothetical protein